MMFTTTAYADSTGGLYICGKEVDAYGRQSKYGIINP